jgi:hypothetical protein
LGSFDTSTGAAITAPRRAIGLPSAESKVIEGGAGGWSDLDRGAVSASHATASTNSRISPATPQLTQRQRMRKRLRIAGRFAAPSSPDGGGPSGRAAGEAAVAARRARTDRA